MNLADITPIDLRDYALSLGWAMVPEAVADGLYVLNSPASDFRQLIFPKDTAEFSSGESASLAIIKLSQFTGLSGFAVVERIREVNEDVLTLRYYSEDKEIHSLAFQSAIDTIEGTKDLLLSAASSIVSPSTFHPRLSRTEAVNLISKTKFRHTESGSFVLKVSCPVVLGSPSVDLFGETYGVPFTRQTFSLVNQVTHKLLNAIESNSEEMFVSEQKQSVKPILSYNFCESLIDLFDDEREIPIDLAFRWSPTSMKKIGIPDLPSTIRLPYSYKPKLEEVKSKLQPEIKSLADTFIATVESLNGDVGPDGKRSGEVKLAILLGVEIINARAVLTVEQYKEADKAHMHPGSYVKIKGKLNPGKYIRLLSDISEFSLVQK
jgi:hypothetical protein